MIIFRYFARQVLLTMMAVTGVLLMITMSGRFIKYLAEAATGELAADALFAIMGYRIPEFLQMIMPLGLFLGILLCYGRLYLDSEMTVLRACGLSTQRLVAYTLGPALLVSVVVGYLSLDVSPWGLRQVADIFQQQRERTEFDALVPGRFQEMGGQGWVTYTEGLSDDRKQLDNVFISQQLEGKDDSAGVILLLAKRGRQYIDENTGSHFLLLEDGYRFEGTPGQADYRVIEYGEYGVRIPKAQVNKKREKAKAKPTSVLLGSDKPEDIAQLQWRLSIPLMVPIVALLALPLSRVNPRQGRYMKLLPSIMLYIVYLFLLSSLTKAVEDGDVPPGAGLWWVHLVFLTAGVVSVTRAHDKLLRKFKTWRAAPGAA